MVKELTKSRRHAGVLQVLRQPRGLDIGVNAGVLARHDPRHRQGLDGCTVSGEGSSQSVPVLREAVDETTGSFTISRDRVRERRLGWTEDDWDDVSETTGDNGQANTGPRAFACGSCSVRSRGKVAQPFQNRC
jgi:hypothetical protein